ncbi:MAG: hypothetical protein GX569_06990 [Candidatus Riflebacteria bacterium]|nr:hypothetical protein [Candidatus Riflebacteria bacterium]
MDNQQLVISDRNGLPVFSFVGHCKAEGIESLSEQLRQMSETGKKKYIFDFSSCKLINSPAMGELLDAILLVDRDFEGHVVVCGLDSLKETLFTISGIIPIAQEARDIDSAASLLMNLQDN